MKTFLTILTAVFALGLTAHAGPPINENCPVTGKPGRLIFRTPTKDGTVIFCSSDCKDKFEKEPTKYTVKKK